MNDNLVTYFLTSLISSILGAIASMSVELFKEWRNDRKGNNKKQPSAKQKEHPIEKKKPGRKRTIIIGAAAGFVVGILVAFLIVRFCNKNEIILWDFDNGIKGWTHFSDPQDASQSAAPGYDTELSTGVLVAKFNFAQVDLNVLPAAIKPRATFWADNLNMDWTGYTKLLIDVKNVDLQLLEMTFSLYTGDCFYEFSGYQSLSQDANWITIEFPFTQPKYKACNSPDRKTNPANVVGIEQFYIIFGTDANLANLDNEVHTLFIDNIRLQK